MFCVPIWKRGDFSRREKGGIGEGVYLLLVSCGHDGILPWLNMVIRKSQRTRYQNFHSDMDPELIIPNSIGPHPLTDRSLGKLWPTLGYDIGKWKWKYNKLQ